MDEWAACAGQCLTWLTSRTFCFFLAVFIFLFLAIFITGASFKVIKHVVVLFLRKSIPHHHRRSSRKRSAAELRMKMSLQFLQIDGCCPIVFLPIPFLLVVVVLRGGASTALLAVLGSARVRTMIQLRLPSRYQDIMARSFVTCWRSSWE